MPLFRWTGFPERRWKTRRLLPLLLALCVLAGCASGEAKYEETWLDVFDTVTSLTGYEKREPLFRQTAGEVHDALMEYHRLFDIYHDYEGLNNLKTVNDSAGVAPVKVDRKIIALLKDCREYHRLTGGKVNAAMGSVLSLWHDAREAGLRQPESAALPDESALAEASRHCSWDTVVLDEENATVYLTDPAQKLDVGAVAKGWAAEQVRSLLPEGYLLNLGGNIVARGTKPDGTPWKVGIQDPEGGGSYLQVLELTDRSAVTSGDYQRYYEVDGIRYCHIIDPATAMPPRLYRSVTVLCEDSALADCLSTALFLLPREEGLALLDRCNAQAVWITQDGTILFSPSFEAALAQ